MPPSTTFNYHVAGGQIPQLGIGSGAALVPICVCEDGVDIRITPKQHPIPSDGGGGPQGLPTEWIQLNANASIRFKSVIYGGTYMNALRAISTASAVEGIMVPPGTLVGGNGYLPQMYLPCPLDGDGPWRFYNVRINNPGAIKISTIQSTPDWEFEAVCYFDPTRFTTIAGLPLYARS